MSGRKEMSINAHDVAVEIASRAMQGLDLSDPEDRVIFRGNIFEITKNTKVAWIKAMALAVGCKPAHSTRMSAVRALSSGFTAPESGSKDQT